MRIAAKRLADTNLKEVLADDLLRADAASDGWPSRGPSGPPMRG